MSVAQFKKKWTWNAATFGKKLWLPAVLVLLTGIGCYFRLTLYGDLRLSIANNDTISYVSSAEAAFPSREMFTGRRLFTTNLFYAAFRPAGGYEILVNGSPSTTRREIQPSFASIAVFQNVFSTWSWAFLALVIASRFKTPILKIAAAVLIIAFAFSPQLADWDSLLASESLSFSLFALQLGLWILVIFRLFSDPRPGSGTILLIAAWLLVVFLWTFLKDAHLYTLLATGVALAGLFLLKPFRQRRTSNLLFSILGILAAMYLLGLITSKPSSRNLLALQNVYHANIVTVPARLEFMRASGMPEPYSPEYATWFTEHAQTGYFRFLAAHPGYVLTSYARDGLAAFSYVMQPYFKAPEAPVRGILITFGEILHPASSFPLLLDVILLLGLWLVALRDPSHRSLAWAWLASWWLAAAHFNLFINVFGDAFALNRHSLLATTMFRLFFWVFTIVLIEQGLVSGLSQECTNPSNHDTLVLL